MTVGRARSALAAAGGLLAVLGALLLADRLLPPDLSRARHQALVLRAADSGWLDGRTAIDGDWRLATRRADVDPRYVALLLHTEDRRFGLHVGVDPLALLRAAGQVVLRGHVVSGGSTLAMQTARLLAPHRHTLRGKLEDMLRAVQLEWRFGRAGVLDLYLTLAPEGGNIEGIRAASLLYFGHLPDRLSAPEAALLVALPRRPEALRPERHPQAAARAVQALRGDPRGIAFRRAAIAHDAPALLATQWQDGRRGLLATTIDGGLQRATAALLRQTPPPAGGTWAALVVAPDGGIAAWLGQAGPGCHGCAVDMVTAWRSPGSTLKPFIYALAFQYGLLSPQTRLRDEAAGFAGYAPHDYDRIFHGATTVRTALQQSYNLPAVEALRRVGVGRFLGTMGDAGIALRLPRGGGGLAVALGGVGVRMLDLARLYHALAQGGVATPLVVSGAAPLTGSRLFGAPAARSVLSILRGTSPPPGTADWRDRGVAFKTGTSYGQRDAWAAATVQGWTAIVWGGRPDGTAAPGISGRETAAPVLSAVLDLLPLRRNLVPDAPEPESGTLGALRVQVAAPPQIVSPADGATVESFAEDGTHPTPIGLEASGGVPPYRWLVDGRALDVPIGGMPAWTPDGPGFVHVAVIDAAGRSAATRFRVR